MDLGETVGQILISATFPNTDSLPDSEPPAPLPIESDWAPIMEFTAADIFQHSPFGDILNSLKYLLLSGEPWPERSGRLGCGGRRNSKPTHHPLCSHCRRSNRHARLRLRRHRRYGRRCRRRLRTSAYKALEDHLVIRHIHGGHPKRER